MENKYTFFKLNDLAFYKQLTSSLSYIYKKPPHDDLFEKNMLIRVPHTQKLLLILLNILSFSPKHYTIKTIHFIILYTIYIFALTIIFSLNNCFHNYWLNTVRPNM